MKGKWYEISLLFFLAVALIGTLLRSVSYVGLPLEYMNLVHAHSHVAFQGWIYTIMILLLTKTFLTKDQIQKGRYVLQFKLSVAVVIGVLISFAMKGYGLYSIVFSTLFQILNYWFIYRFISDTRQHPLRLEKTTSLRFIITGLWLGAISTLLPFGIGALSARGLGNSEVYQSMVYSFLHLQYNGWFLFVAIGLFFHFLESSGLKVDQKHLKRFYVLFVLAVIPAISLSLLGMDFADAVRVPAFLAAALTIAALVFFVLALPKNLLAYLSDQEIVVRLFILGFLSSFILKTTLQSLSALPYFEAYAFFNKPIVIAYLHLSLIGAVSLVFLALIVHHKWIKINALSRAGSFLFLLCFVFTEILLAARGLGQIFSQIFLILGSAGMAMGILLKIFSSTLKNKAHGRI
ncbi:hypothetical protein O3Q51_13905 [Cryomorphaceae bacterium 1068]|nr:hypothetical protein [Cryomorphaceae bacterium 1068]